MKKKLLTTFLLSALSTPSFSYVLIGEGKVEAPQINGSPGFSVKEMPVPTEQITNFQADKKKSEDDLRQLDGKRKQCKRKSKRIHQG